MTYWSRRAALLGAVAIAVSACGENKPKLGQTPDELEASSRSALSNLQIQQPYVNRLLAGSSGVLVMPSIKNAGFMFGGTFGKGSLFRGGVLEDNYSVAGVSWGLQFGAEAFGTALFFMSDAVLDEFKSRDGWTAGADLSFTMINEAEAAKIDSNTVSDQVYAIVFDQKGVHLGGVIKGAKYSRIGR